MGVAGDAAVGMLDVNTVAIAAAPARSDDFAVPSRVNRIAGNAIDINAGMETAASFAVRGTDTGGCRRPNHGFGIHGDTIDGGGYARCG